MIRAFLTVKSSGGNPPFIDPANLGWEVLLDSRKITGVADGAPILLWAETSGNGRDAHGVPGFEPIYRLHSSPNGLPLADFGSVPNSQMFGTLPAIGVGNGLGFSFYAYYYLDSVPKTGSGFDSQIIFGDDTGVGFRMFGSLNQGVGDTRSAFTSNGGGTMLDTGQAIVGSHLMSVICPPPSGSTGFLFIDGLAVASAAWGTNPETTYLVSGNAAQNVWLRGRLAFAGFGKRVDSPFIQLGLLNFFRRTFG